MGKEIRTVKDFCDIGTNKLMGVTPQMDNSIVKFNGTNNILFCEDGVCLKNVKISFEGNNSIVYLSKNKYKYRMNVFVYNDNVFYMGEDNCMNDSYGKMVVILSEQRHFFAGDCGLFSFGLFFRTADPHLVYSCDTYTRINLSKSIFIGDHVWIGQNSLILKGTQICSGSIIAANSVVASKHISHNTVWGGNPSTLIKRDVFWDSSCVHEWTEDNRTEDSMNYSIYAKKYLGDCSPNAWIYVPDAGSISFSDLDSRLSVKGSQEKLKEIQKIIHEKRKNRFARG